MDVIAAIAIITEISFSPAVPTLSRGDRPPRHRFRHAGETQTLE